MINLLRCRFSAGTSSIKSSVPDLRLCSVANSVSKTRPRRTIFNDFFTFFSKSKNMTLRFFELLHTISRTRNRRNSAAAKYTVAMTSVFTTLLFLLNQWRQFFTRIGGPTCAAAGPYGRTSRPNCHNDNQLQRMLGH